jgi:hypothetical protein
VVWTATSSALAQNLQNLPAIGSNSRIYISGSQITDLLDWIYGLA